MSLYWVKHPYLLTTEFENKFFQRHPYGEQKGSWIGEDYTPNLSPQQVCWPPSPCLSHAPCCSPVKAATLPCFFA